MRRTATGKVQTEGMEHRHGRRDNLACCLCCRSGGYDEDQGRYLYFQTSSPMRGWLAVDNEFAPLSRKHPLLEPPPKSLNSGRGVEPDDEEATFVRQGCMKERHLAGPRARAGRSRSLA